MHHNFSLVKIIMLQDCQNSLVHDRLLCTLHLHNLYIFLPVIDELGYFLRSSFLAKTSNNLIITLMGFNLITPHCCSFSILLLSLNPEFCSNVTGWTQILQLQKVCARSATATDFLIPLFSLLAKQSFLNIGMVLPSKISDDMFKGFQCWFQLRYKFLEKR